MTHVYDKKNPFPSTVLNNVALTPEKSVKETIQIDFNLEGSGLTYEAGDALGVCPENDYDLVDAIISKMGYSPEEIVPSCDGTPVPLREALGCSYDITSLNKSILTKWSEKSDSSELSAVLASGNSQDIKDYCCGRDILDLITSCPAQFENATEFVGILKKLMPRLYSIASSPNAHPGEVQLVVGVVRYDSLGRRRGGVCSTYMADRVGRGPCRIFVHVSKNFRLPEDKSKSVIMVGPGTGIAPFRAFIEERIVSEATGRNWFFFGNPYKETDFLYEEWLSGLEKTGKLKLSLAFSRDQAEKLYVQHLMVQNGKELWTWLQEGAHFYVCGDASRMAKDVDEALRTVAMEHGGLSAEEADDYFRQLKKDKRYQRDVY